MGRSFRNANRMTVTVLQDKRPLVRRLNLTRSVACRAGTTCPRGDPRTRNVITADGGDRPTMEEGDAAMAIEFDGWAVVR